MSLDGASTGPSAPCNQNAAVPEDIDRRDLDLVKQFTDAIVDQVHHQRPSPENKIDAVLGRLEIRNNNLVYAIGDAVNRQTFKADIGAAQVLAATELMTEPFLQDSKPGQRISAPATRTAIRALNATLDRLSSLPPAVQAKIGQLVRHSDVARRFGLPVTKAMDEYDANLLRQQQVNKMAARIVDVLKTQRFPDENVLQNTVSGEFARLSKDQMAKCSAAEVSLAARRLAELQLRTQNIKDPKEATRVAQSALRNVPKLSRTQITNFRKLFLNSDIIKGLATRYGEGPAQPSGEPPNAPRDRR